MLWSRLSKIEHAIAWICMKIHDLHIIIVTIYTNSLSTLNLIKLWGHAHMWIWVYWYLDYQCYRLKSYTVCNVKEVTQWWIHRELSTNKNGALWWILAHYFGFTALRCTVLIHSVLLSLVYSSGRQLFPVNRSDKPTVRYLSGTKQQILRYFSWSVLICSRWETKSLGGHQRQHDTSFGDNECLDNISWRSRCFNLDQSGCDWDYHPCSLNRFQLQHWCCLQVNASKNNSML